jgi:pSer/pThr/pTyr-binding forkhead associated (FHA) protein
MSQFIVEDEAGVRWEPIGRQLMVGRSPSSHLVVRSAMASRRHAWVWQRQGQVIVEDLGSTHGTYVNGQLVTSPRSLVHHDRITIGNAQLTYVAQTGAEAEPTPRSPAATPVGDEGRTPPAGVSYPGPGDLYCGQCGASNHPQARFCGHCGQSLDLASVEAEAGARGRDPAWAQHSTTPVEPIEARPFPTAPTQQHRKGSAGAWGLIVLLALLALFLLAVFGVLLVYVLG